MRVIKDRLLCYCRWRVLCPPGPTIGRSGHTAATGFKGSSKEKRVSICQPDEEHLFPRAARFSTVGSGELAWSMQKRAYIRPAESRSQSRRSQKGSRAGCLARASRRASATTSRKIRRPQRPPQSSERSQGSCAQALTERRDAVLVPCSERSLSASGGGKAGEVTCHTYACLDQRMQSPDRGLAALHRNK